MTTYDTLLSNLQALVPEIDSTSGAGILEKIASTISPIIDNTNSEITNTEDIITNIIAQKQPGKALYYTSQALLFEYDLVNNVGVDLVIDPVSLQNVYANPDPTKQIIKVAVFDENTMTLKVAFQDTDGKLKALPDNIKTLFDNYFYSTSEWANLPVNKVSNNPNLLLFGSTIYYYPNYDLSQLKASVINFLLEYQLNNQSSDGKFFTNDISDYIKLNVPGIRNMVISGTTIDGVSFNGETILLKGYFDYSADPTNWITYAPA